MKRLLIVALVYTLSSIGILSTTANADPPPRPEVTGRFTGSGQMIHNLPDGGRIVITVSGTQPTGKEGATAERTQTTRELSTEAEQQDTVEYGIERWNGQGDLMWTFSETVTWGYDMYVVTFTQPTSRASTWYAGWYVESKPPPTWYWVYHPMKTESHAEASFKCCYSFPTQTDNPHIWIWTDAWGFWEGRYQCC